MFIRYKFSIWTWSLIVFVSIFVLICIKRTYLTRLFKLCFYFIIQSWWDHIFYFILSYSMKDNRYSIHQISILFNYKIILTDNILCNWITKLFIYLSFPSKDSSAKWVKHKNYICCAYVCGVLC